MCGLWVGLLLGCGRVGYDARVDPDAATASADAASIEPADAAGSDDPASDAGPLLACADVDLGSALGDDVTKGDLDDFADDDRASCSTGAKNEAHYAWTAPSDGTYRFRSCGKPFKTTLYVRDGCAGPLRSCNTGQPVGPGCPGSPAPPAVVDLGLRSGESVLVAVEAGDFAGDFTLSIARIGDL